MRTPLAKKTFALVVAGIAAVAIAGGVASSASAVSAGAGDDVFIEGNRWT